MTRKDFETVARAIATLPVNSREKAARALAIEFEKINERFSRERFYLACGIEETHKLRLQGIDDVARSTEIHNLPVVFTGTRKECLAYARKNGYRWRDNEFMLYSGYWFDPATGDCLYLT